MSVHIPIARLEPGTVDTSAAHIKGVVTLLWPYSSSNKAFSILLVEPDFRLRRQKGQVRLTFRGSCAKSLARAGIVSGNELRIRLSGCKWLQEDPSSTSIRTPGSSVGWELLFDEQLYLEVNQDGRAKIFDIDTSAGSPQPNECPEPRTPTFAPRTTLQIVDAVSPTASIRSHASWSSPAFLKKRNFNEALGQSSYDLFADENAFNAEPTAKRHKSGRESQQWRILQNEPDDEEEATPVDAATAALSDGSKTKPNTLNELQQSELEQAEVSRHNALAVTTPAMIAEEAQVPSDVGFNDVSNDRGAGERLSEDRLNIFEAATGNVFSARDDAADPLMDDVIDAYDHVDQNSHPGIAENIETEEIVENVKSSITGAQLESQPTWWPELKPSQPTREEIVDIAQTSPVAESFDFGRQDDEAGLEQETRNRNTPGIDDLIDQTQDYERLGVQPHQDAEADEDTDSLATETEAYESNADAGIDLIDIEAVNDDPTARGEPLPDVTPMVVDGQLQTTQMEFIEVSSEIESSESEATDSVGKSDYAKSGTHAAERHNTISAEVTTEQDLKNHSQDMEIYDSSYVHTIAQTEPITTVDEQSNGQEHVKHDSDVDSSGEDVLTRSNEPRSDNEGMNSEPDKESAPFGDHHQNGSFDAGRAAAAWLSDAIADDQEHSQLGTKLRVDENRRTLPQRERSEASDDLMNREAVEISLIPESQPQGFGLSTGNALDLHDSDPIEVTHQDVMDSDGPIAHNDASNVDIIPSNSLSVTSSNIIESDGAAAILSPQAEGTDVRHTRSPELTHETAQGISEGPEEAEDVKQNLPSDEAILEARILPAIAVHQDHVLTLANDKPRESPVLDQLYEPETEPALRRSTRRKRQQSPEIMNDRSWHKPSPRSADQSPSRRTGRRSAKLREGSASTWQEKGKPHSSAVDDGQTNRRGKPEARQPSRTPERRTQTRRSTGRTKTDLSSPESEQAHIERSSQDQIDGDRGSPAPTTDSSADETEAKRSGNDAESNIDQVSQQLLQEAQQAHDIEASLPPLSTGLHTKHAYLAPLSNLLPSSRTAVDTMNVVVGATKPERAYTGPRDWHLTLYVTDGSMQNASQALRSVQIFRPSKSALPLSAAADDIVLLHAFKCESQRRKPILISTARSGWAVFDTDGKAKISGPAVEYGQDEVDLSQRLRSWWTSVPADQKMQLRTNFMQARDAAKEATRRKSGRRSIVKPGAMAHELRDGTVYPYTDTPLVSDE